MLNGGKKMEEDRYFMIFVQSRLNYLSDDEKNWTNYGEISLFVKSLFFCFVVECINKCVCCFFVSRKNGKGLLFYDYYLTFDSFNFRSICTNDGKRLTNRGWILSFFLITYWLHRCEYINLFVCCLLFE